MFPVLLQFALLLSRMFCVRQAPTSGSFALVEFLRTWYQQAVDAGCQLGPGAEVLPCLMSIKLKHFNQLGRGVVAMHDLPYAYAFQILEAHENPFHANRERSTADLTPL